MQIYVSGSLAFDRIMTFPGRFSDHILPDKIHILNVCFLVNGLEEKFGGTAGNIAYTLALLNEKPLILSCAGKDFDPYAAWLTGFGLSMGGIRRDEEQHTAGAYITTDQSDNQITGFNPGAMGTPCGYEFGAVDAGADLAIVSPGNIEDMLGLPEVYKAKGVRYIFDPGQQITALTGEQMLAAITGSFALVTNDYELEMIVQATGESREQLQERTGAIVTTLGEQGSVIRQNGDTTDVPPAQAAATVDPTGAGYAFRAGLIKGLAMGRPLADAALLGSVAASYCVEQRGTQAHSFTLEEYASRYEDNFGPMV